ncbi:hypothetical protein SNEBB_000874 [Seison nebaliae]|nr:hypothetical protein SNEBB_000874 [Seison nebaliae]
MRSSFLDTILFTLRYYAEFHQFTHQQYQPNDKDSNFLFLSSLERSHRRRKNKFLENDQKTSTPSNNQPRQMAKMTEPTPKKCKELLSLQIRKKRKINYVQRNKHDLGMRCRDKKFLKKNQTSTSSINSERSTSSIEDSGTSIRKLTNATKRIKKTSEEFDTMSIVSSVSSSSISKSYDLKELRLLTRENLYEIILNQQKKIIIN